MRIIGLTGGMGSGKTTVAGFFMELGIPVYIADEAGKRLMNTSEKMKLDLISLFGKQAYSTTGLNREYISSRVFKDSELLQKLNNIVHPAVAADFKIWLQNQQAEYVIYEAAILFETGGDKKCESVILVTSSREERIERIKKRDDHSQEEIEARMDKQWSDVRKRQFSQFEIKNDSLIDTRKQVGKIHEILLNHSKN